MSTQTRLMADCQVVIIDDDPELCYMLSELLRTEGYVTATFQSGDEGLRALRNALPQLVILDVTMPDMDGFEVLRFLRMESDVPVLILTAPGRRPRPDHRIRTGRRRLPAQALQSA